MCSEKLLFRWNCRLDFDVLSMVKRWKAVAAITFDESGFFFSFDVKCVLVFLIFFSVPAKIALTKIYAYSRPQNNCQQNHSVKQSADARAHTLKYDKQKISTNETITQPKWLVFCTAICVQCNALFSTHAQ